MRNHPLVIKTVGRLETYELHQIGLAGCAIAGRELEDQGYVVHRVLEPVRHLTRDAKIVVMIGRAAGACDKPSQGE